eukprot:Awhi_evm1s11226
MNKTTWNCTKPFVVGENCDITYAEYLRVPYEILTALHFIYIALILAMTLYTIVVEIKQSTTSIKKLFLQFRHAFTGALVSLFLCIPLFVALSFDLSAYRGILSAEAALILFHLVSAALMWTL